MSPGEHIIILVEIDEKLVNFCPIMDHGICVVDRGSIQNAWDAIPAGALRCFGRLLTWCVLGRMEKKKRRGNCLHDHVCASGKRAIHSELHHENVCARMWRACIRKLTENEPIIIGGMYVGVSELLCGQALIITNVGWFPMFNSQCRITNFENLLLKLCPLFLSFMGHVSICLTGRQGTTFPINVHAFGNFTFDHT